MQTHIINMLLEKLPEFMLDGLVFLFTFLQHLQTFPLLFFIFKMSSCSPPHSTGVAGLSIPRIIINQLKWLDRVVDSKV